MMCGMNLNPCILRISNTAFHLNVAHFVLYRCQTYEELTESGIPTTVILDAAVGYVMEKVDMVLCGAEGVVESGGIINKVKCLTILSI